MTKVKTEVDPIEVVLFGDDPLGGKHYRVSDEEFYTVFAVDGSMIEIMPSPLGGVSYDSIKDYGKFLKKAMKALYDELPKPVEQ